VWANAPSYTPPRGTKEFGALRRKEGHSIIRNLFTRRDFSVGRAALLSGLGAARPALGSIDSPRTARFAASEEISHTGEAIHQEVVFQASRKRVYEDSPTPNNSIRSCNSVRPRSPACLWETNRPKSAVNWVAPSHFLAAKSSGDISTLWPTSELSELGGWSTGIRVSTRLRGSSSLS
jgi:hypothetical protein